MEHHDRYSPSSLPALNACPLWKSEGGAAANHGTLLHQALYDLKTKGQYNREGLTLDDEIMIEWCAERVPEWSEYEKRVIIRDDATGEELTFGTADAICRDGDTSIVTDYKFGMRHDYRAQMAAYALGAMQEHGTHSAVCGVLYGRLKSEEIYRFNYNDAYKIVNGIIKKAKAGGEPKVNDFCGWCANKLHCPAFTGVVRATGADVVPIDDSQLIDPAVIATALEVADKALQWAERVKARAKELAESGVKVPGWKLSERTTRREVQDITGACKATGIRPDAFLQACSVKIGELEKLYYDEVGAKSKAEAKRTVAELIQPHLKESKTYNIFERAGK